MRLSVIKGMSYGITSGIITTLGLIMGLHSGTGSKSIVLGGIVTIAIADAFSDALGMHISEESAKNHSEKEVWAATLSAFTSKFVFAIQFIVPFLLFPLETAIYISVAWGLLLLAVLSFLIARNKKESPYSVIIEHLCIAMVVIFITHFVGDFVARIFG